MRERNKDILGIPTDVESYKVVPRALARLIGNTAGKASEASKGVTENVVERSKDASQTVLGMGTTALASVTELFQMMNNEARIRLSGLPGLHDLHPGDDSEEK